MHEVIIFFGGALAGFLGATVGGGGFISIPLLLLLGFSPQASIALNKVGDIGTFISAAGKYWKSKRIDWRMAAIIAGIYIVGSIVGTQVMVRLSAGLLEVLIVISILLIVPFVFANPKLGLKKIKTSRLKKIMGFIMLFFLAIMGAVIGAGGAVLSTLVMMYFLDTRSLTDTRQQRLLNYSPH